MQTIEEILEEVSVIIPIAPGSIAWRDLIIDLRQFPPGTEFLFCRSSGLSAYEQRLIDHLRKTYTVKWLLTSNNTAEQLNRGALVASKKFLWFLPSESHFRRRTLNALGTVLRMPALAIYYFDVVPLQATLSPIRLLQTNFHSRLRKMPTLMHGICMQNKLYCDIGPFRADLPRAGIADFLARATDLGAEIRPAHALVYNNSTLEKASPWIVKKTLGLLESAKGLYTSLKN